MRCTGRCYWITLATVILLFVSGCGFHLRGSVELPAVMERTFLSGITADSALGSEIRNTLERAGGAVVADPDMATSTLVIQGEKVQKTVVGVNSNGKASEYELRHTLSYSLLDSEQKSLVEAQTVRVIRQFLYDSANVLSSGTEEAELRGEMRGSAVRQMINRLRIELQKY
jgi:LPS-assembly lipoprotein